MKLPKEKDDHLDLNLLQRIFKLLLEITGKQGQFSDKDKEPYMVVDSHEYESKKGEFQNILENGGKIFIISTYQTLGSGQNLQYKAPHPSQLIDVSDGNVTWNKDNKTDFNAIYLDKPTHLLQQITTELEDKGFVKYLFQLEFLAQRGEVSKSQIHKEIQRTFKFLNGEQGGKAQEDLYQKEDFRKHACQRIIQAIGRICRTNLKFTNIYVYADLEIRKLLTDFDLEKPFVLKEFQELVKKAQAEENKPSDERIERLENKADTVNRKVKARISKYINRGTAWKWTKQDMETWKNLRKQCLKHPTLTEAEFQAQEDITDLYIELPPAESNVLYFDQKSDYNQVNLRFDSNGKSKLAVSQESARLSAIAEIPNVKTYFKEKNYALEFKIGKYIIAPQLFNNVYKGVLGETIGKIIFEKELRIKLDDLEHEEHFELFDYKVKDTDIYIDFKHWKTTTKIEENQPEILKKLEKVGGVKVLIVNILYSEKKQYKPTKTKDSKIIQIPGLWNIKEKQYIKNHINKIIEEVQC